MTLPLLRVLRHCGLGQPCHISDSNVLKSDSTCLPPSCQGGQMLLKIGKQWWPQKRLFKYSSEPLGEDQLRVLDIRPGTRKEVLRCNLVTIARESGTPYKALSYAWGDPARKYFIYVNGKRFYIHKSLHEALHQIRHRTAVVRLWTDGICIDQNNIAERNAQVQAMGRTYAEAEEVLIWLGSAPAGSRMLHDFCDFIQDHSHLTLARWKALHPSVEAVLSSPWFNRLWVLQEVLLASKGTVLLGEQQCNLDILLKWDDIDRVQLGSLHEQESDSFDENHDFLIATGPEHRPLTALCKARKMGLSGLDWQALLHLCRFSICSDLRDRIFGMVGVARVIGAEHEVVDYNLTTEEVFVRATVNLLIRDPNVLIMLEAGRDGNAGLPDLPSWVADFSREPVVAPLPRKLYCAGGPQHLVVLDRYSFSQDYRKLELEGYAFDSIQRSVNCWLEEPYHPLTIGQFIAEKLIELEQEYVDEWGLPNPYGDYNDRLEAFWRTLIANMTVDRSAITSDQMWADWPVDDNGAPYQVLTARAEPAASCGYAAETWGAFTSVTAEFSQAMCTACTGRRLFTTRNGYLGMGPGSTDIDDEIVVIPGMRTPFVVRRLLAMSQYRLVGPCYVHGIMQGEFVERLANEGDSDGPRLFELV